MVMPTFLVGKTVLASELELIARRVDFLSAPPQAELRATTVQSITNNTPTPILYDAEDSDTHGGHSTSSNTSRYTAQVAGWYLCSGNVSMTGSATNRRGCWWRKNGADVAGTEAVISAGDDTAGLTIPARAKLIFLAVGDYVELVGYQDSGGPLNTVVAGSTPQPSMSITWKSD
jgi:hypothetical protein